MFSVRNFLPPYSEGASERKASWLSASDMKSSAHTVFNVAGASSGCRTRADKRFFLRRST